MDSILARRSFRVAALTLVLLSVAAGVAYAAIPDAGSLTYHACMLKGVGTIRIIDPAQQHCSAALETEITFNQKGPPGPQGLPGANGAQGANGISPSVSQVGAGDPNCPSGGAAITDAANHVAYICNGAAGPAGHPGADGQPFSGTFTSPNGQYSISVTDSGVLIDGPGTTAVSVSSTGLSVRSGGTLEIRGDNDVTVKAGHNVSIDSSSNATLKASGEADLESSGTMTVKGSAIDLGAGACAPAVRTTDQVLGTAPPDGGPVFSSILTGSTSVCIG